MNRAHAAEYPGDFASSSSSNNAPPGQQTVGAGAASEDDLASFWDDVAAGQPGDNDVGMAGADFFNTPPEPATPSLAPGTKRKATSSTLDTHTNKKPRTVDVDLTQDDQSTQPLLSAWHTAGQDSPDYREYLANKDEIDRLYTVGDKHRKETDDWENKLRWLKQQRIKEARNAQRQGGRKHKQPHTFAAPAPVPAPAPVLTLAPVPQVAQATAVPTRRQGALYATDIERCPVFGSRELEDYPLLGGSSDRYLYLHYDRHLCGTPQCPIWEHPSCCCEGYTKENLERRVEQHETRDRQKIERWTQKGKLDDRHKTWTGWYSAKIALKCNERYLLVKALQWTPTGERRQQMRLARMAQPLAAPQSAPEAPAVEQEEQDVPSAGAKEVQSVVEEAPSSPESLRKAATQVVLGQMKVRRLAVKRALTTAQRIIVSRVDVATVLETFGPSGFDKVVGMVAKEM